MLNFAEFPSSEGDAWFSTMEKIATGPLAFAPAQTVQLAHPVICSMLLLVTAPAGGLGKGDTGVEVGVGVGVGADVFTVIVRGVLKTAPVESHACTTTLCLPDAMANDVSSLLVEVKYALTLST